MRHFDLAGASTVTGGLVALVYAIVEASSWGWGSSRTLGVAAFGIALLAAGGLFARFFFASLYLQNILGYSPLTTGLAFLPVTSGS